MQDWVRNYFFSPHIVYIRLNGLFEIWFEDDDITPKISTPLNGLPVDYTTVENASEIIDALYKVGKESGNEKTDSATSA